MLNWSQKNKNFSVIILLIGLFLLPLITFGATVNVSGSVTCPDNKCEKGGDTAADPPLVIGCRDPRADNYNPLANQTGECIYFVPPVFNLAATYNQTAESARISWVNPSGYAYYQYTRIIRATTLTSNPEGGSLVYQGGGTFVTDTDVAPGGHYFYIAFVRGIEGLWSAAVVTSITIPKGGEEPLPPPPTKELLPTDIFQQFPTASGQLPSRFSLLIKQLGALDKNFLQASVVRIDGRKNTTFFLNYALVPEVLKTIGISIIDPQAVTKTFSFLLRARPDGSGYEATIGPFAKPGRYPVNVYFLNFQEQTISRLSGYLVVTRGGLLQVSLRTTETIRKFFVPVGAGLGVTAGLLQILFSAARVDSIYDLWLAFLRLFGLLLGYLGFRRRVVPWGTVYDAITKQPIDPAYISVEGPVGKELTSAITDIDGRYGFFLPQGTYRLKAGKTHYNFPSQSMAGRTADELYNNLYFGEDFALAGGEVVNKNIPLDPVGFDWNEFIKSQANLFQVHTRRELWRRRIMNIIYTAGFLFALGSFSYKPNWLDLGTIILFSVLGIIDLWVKRRFKVWRITRADGRPLSFAIIKLFLPDINQLIKTVVADAYGRVYVLVSPGRYYYTVEEKKTDGSYAEVYRSGAVDLPKGVLANDILVPGVPA